MNDEPIDAPVTTRPVITVITGPMHDEPIEAPVTTPPQGLPPVVLIGADGTPRLCPWLLSLDDVADLFRLHDSKTRFPKATIARYRRMGLRTVRVGRRTWYTLPDVLTFISSGTERL